MINFKLHLKGLLLVCLLMGNGVVLADDELDVTMRMVPEDVTLPDAVTKVIELPGSMPAQANPHSANGMETANEARDSHREFASDMVEEAKSRGRKN